MKVRLFPKKSQIEKLNRMFGISRWIYNNCLGILKSVKDSPIKYKNEKTNTINYTKFKISNHKIRDWLRKIETLHDKSDFEPHISKFVIDLVDYMYDESKNSFPELPEWCEDKVQDRIYRGIIQNLVQNMNTIVSNKGNIGNLRLKTKKDKNDFICSESWCGQNIIPKDFGVFKGHYKVGRKKIKLEELRKVVEKKSFIIHFDKTKKQYNLLLPVTTEWFTKFKHETNETQECFKSLKNRKSFVVLDTGVRTFQTAYSFDHIIDLAKDDHYKLYKILLEKDRLISEKSKFTHDKKKTNNINNRLKKLQCRITNLTDELHWKVIGFLTKNYNHIMIPDFKISEMVTSKKISRITKRLMYSFRFCKFKERLSDKCKERDCLLQFVNESYTSKTCGSCGHLNNSLGGSKIFKCNNCKIVIDRDYNGSRNILLRNCC